MSYGYGESHFGPPNGPGVLHGLGKPGVTPARIDLDRVNSTALSKVSIWPDSSGALRFLNGVPTNYDSDGTVISGAGGSVTLNGAEVLTNKTLKTSNIFADTTTVSKTLTVSLVGATAAKGTTLTFVQTLDRVITFPDATCTLIGKNTTDVLTNKSFDCDGTGNVLTNVNAQELDSVAMATSAFGIPFIIPVVNAGAATINIFSGNAPFKFRVLDVWSIATKVTNSGTFSVDNGTTAITAAVAYATADKGIVRAGSIDDATHDIALNGSLRLISSVAGDTAIVYILAMRLD